MENPLVSVIIPVYKVEPYLRTCVDSVLAQTYENLEVILVDDGSPDNCPAICDEYAAKDSRVRVIHKENGGLSDARNAGLEAAKGEWICFVDSDDAVDENYVGFLLEAAVENDCEIAVCGYKCFSGTYEIASKKRLSKKCKVISPAKAVKNQYAADVTKYVVAWNKIYRRDLFSSGIRYPKGRLHEDDFTTYKLFLRANKIADLDSCLNYYRIHGESITARFSPKRIQDYIAAHSESLAYIRTRNDKPLLAEALYVLFLSHFKLFGSEYFDSQSFSGILDELNGLKRFLPLKRRLKFAYKKAQMKFLRRK